VASTKVDTWIIGAGSGLATVTCRMTAEAVRIRWSSRRSRLRRPWLLTHSRLGCCGHLVASAALVRKVFVPLPQWLGLRLRLTGGRNGAFDAYEAGVNLVVRGGTVAAFCLDSRPWRMYERKPDRTSGAPTA
jgi:hypothetical protein